MLHIKRDTTNGMRTLISNEPKPRKKMIREMGLTAAAATILGVLLCDSGILEVLKGIA